MKTFINLVSSLFILALFTACGGGGGDGVTPPAPPVIPTGTFQKTVVLDGLSGGVPVIHDAPFRHYQLLYRFSEIKARGFITGMSLRHDLALAANISCPNTTIRLGQSTLPNLTTNLAPGGNVEQGAGSLVTVLNNATVTVPAGAAGDYFQINFTKPFYFSGYSNLVVDILREAGCTGSQDLRVTLSTIPYDASAYTTDATAPNTAELIDTSLPDAIFHFAGGDAAVTYPNSFDAEAPFNSDPNLRHLQMLYLAGDMNGKGPITGIAMISSENPTDIAQYTITVKLGHTTLTALTPTYANNFNVGSPVTMASSVSFTVPAGVPSGTPIWFPLNNIFNYNGTDNLIVDIEVTNATTLTYWQYDLTYPNRTLFAAVGNATGTVSPGAFNTVFRYHGGTVDFRTAGTEALAVPFIDNGAKVHYLYDSASLGTGGTITKLAFHLKNNSIASDYTNFTVRIGQTSHNMLSAFLFADDFESSALVREPATFTLPSSYKAGDWVEIPLTSGFLYDPTKNLVVETSNTGGTLENGTQAELSATRFPSHTTATLDPTGAAPTDIGDYAVDLRLWIQK